MEFGRVDNIDLVDFTFPADHPITTDVLLHSAKLEPRVYVGCAKWGRPDWIGKIYPKGTKEADFLKHYVKHFNSIELNATHYRIFDKKTINKWKDTADEGFKFSPKFFQGITHWKRLKDVEDLTTQFYNSVEELKEKLGPCFLQLHENFSPKNLLQVESYLKSLPKDVKVHIELRHPDWFKDSPLSKEAFEMFRDYGVGTVITDTSGRRDCMHMRLTTPIAFIRFVGNGLHPTDYLRINDWVMHIKKWLAEGLQELYFFMHQHDELHSPELCAYVIKELNKHCNLKLHVPVFEGSVGQPSLF
ncbi:DUF72 domain-containing protein [Solitalea koreensis]|uniref:Uncharacterized conserved protein YecE, DUF72 family n=1 Tax=Solitalea koreensis TaxID=543615 RepID=A0A521DA63_9SPHI|nr:DUF72 domain-containing protein [Solitalea koreensis]SMO68599.1 Uncharacterized conserved protein YecE, DUF72 family [Solitalea koreensis]